MLWDPASHERAVDDAWDEGRACAAIREIAADAEGTFDGAWPAHPQDAERGDAGPGAACISAERAWSTRCGGSLRVAASSRAATPL